MGLTTDEEIDEYGLFADLGKGSINLTASANLFGTNLCMILSRVYACPYRSNQLHHGFYKRSGASGTRVLALFQEGRLVSIDHP